MFEKTCFLCFLEFADRVDEVYRYLGLLLYVGGEAQMGWVRPQELPSTTPSVTDAALACPPCCPCVCHVAKPGLELRWVPVGSSDDILRAPCRASPLRASRSRINPPVISHPPVVLTSYRSTAERKLLPPLKPPKPTRVRQETSTSGELPQPDPELPSEDGIQTGRRQGN